MTQVLTAYLEIAYLMGVGFFSTFAGPPAQQLIRNAHPYDPHWFIDIVIAVLITCWPITALVYIMTRPRKRNW